MEVDESNFKILDRASKITGTDYDIKWFNAEEIDGYIEEDNLISMIEDLICEVDRLQEELEDTIQDRNDNYKPIPYEEQIGYNRNW